MSYYIFVSYCIKLYCILYSILFYFILYEKINGKNERKIKKENKTINKSTNSEVGEVEKDTVDRKEKEVAKYGTVEAKNRKEEIYEWDFNSFFFEENLFENNFYF